MQTFEQSIAAGGRAVFPAGRVCQVISLTTAVDVKLFDEKGRPAGEAKGVLAGLKLRPSSGFRKVEIYSSVTQTVKVGISDGESEYDSTSITGTITTQETYPTQFISSANQVIAAAGNYVIAQNADRAELFITNKFANTVELCIGDSAANEGVEITPGQTFTLRTTAAVTVYNPGGASATIGIAETRK